MWPIRDKAFASVDPLFTLFIRYTKGARLPLIYASKKKRENNKIQVIILQELQCTLIKTLRYALVMGFTH
jgi:hypothetical protein